VFKQKKTFHRYDLFNSKYNPFGNSLLQTVFLDHINDIDGRYLGELVQDVMSIRSRNPNHLYEVSVNIYGRSKNEWENFAIWVVNHGLLNSQFRWIGCINLDFTTILKNQDVVNFEEYLRNIFEPLFEVLNDPASYPNLSKLMPFISGFSTSIYEKSTDNIKQHPNPTDWTSEENPPYYYFLFYLWANNNSLNAYRERLGLSTLLFRPISGFTGGTDELAVAFLVADSVSHGNQLKHSSILQYLFYLEQIGLSMAILKENSIIVDYKDHPFNKFLKRGLNVTISTASPLQIHFTNDPLAEEYAIASQFWKLGPVEIAEIARNSVLLSGFDHEIKKNSLGDHYDQGVNDPNRTDIPEIRYQYRFTCLERELELINSIAV